ncbi:triose-phosphate isomerase [Candidatus Woesearchaeota archaeon]|nr:triose-phosphate isomerase [Candidatus Woesearchaeota archaeon]
MNFPCVVVNFKTYESSIGENAVNLAKICDSVSKETGKNIAVCVSVSDLYRVSSQVSISVFSEHVDGDDFGAHTGKVLVKDILDNGAKGSLLNHSEDRYRLDLLDMSIQKLKDNKLLSIVCANNSESAEAIATFEPDVIAIEPPELIGGDISVTNANPDIVVNTIQKVHNVANIPVLCGAGIKNGMDVKKAIELGCVGVLIASGVTKAKDPREALLDLVSGL